METRVMTVGLNGMDGFKVTVEVSARTGWESFIIVGLPDASIKESKERVCSTLYYHKADIHSKKIIVNLSPSEFKKFGPGFDAAIVVAVLKAIGHLNVEIKEDVCIIGAISLSGELKSFEGLIPTMTNAMKLGFKKIYHPIIDTSLFPTIIGTDLIPINSIDHLISHLKGQETFQLSPSQVISPINPITHTETSVDFHDIIGHEQAKRALEIAAAGGHHILMTGPPGCGKSMLADAFKTILPDLSGQELLDIYGLYQLGREALPQVNRPPLRHPHHSASAVSLLGGGTYPKPGEISFAHHGVLFLDELAEFSRKTIDMLRQPIENGAITISRAKQSVTYPAKFILIAATNPCPCGYYGSNQKYCTCTMKQVKAYQQRISGPVLDRMDFILPLKSVPLHSKDKRGEYSRTVRKRVEEARKRQINRFGVLNNRVSYHLIQETSNLTNNQLQTFQEVCRENGWSNRAQVKILRVARTISDLMNTQNINNEAIEEAIKWKKESLL
ncbi:YifB family Mg chelatase-like AAA ATPase [Bacillus sp. AK128]